MAADGGDISHLAELIADHRLVAAELAAIEDAPDDEARLWRQLTDLENAIYAFVPPTAADTALRNRFLLDRLLDGHPYEDEELARLFGATPAEIAAIKNMAWVRAVRQTGLAFACHGDPADFAGYSITRDPDAVDRHHDLLALLRARAAA